MQRDLLLSWPRVHLQLLLQLDRRSLGEYTRDSTVSEFTCFPKATPHVAVQSQAREDVRLSRVGITRYARGGFKRVTRYARHKRGPDFVAACSNLLRVKWQV